MKNIIKRVNKKQILVQIIILTISLLIFSFIMSLILDDSAKSIIYNRIEIEITPNVNGSYEVVIPYIQHPDIDLANIIINKYPNLDIVSISTPYGMGLQISCDDLVEIDIQFKTIMEKGRIILFSDYTDNLNYIERPNMTLAIEKKDDWDDDNTY